MSVSVLADVRKTNMMEPKEYKQYHESFMVNNNGTTPWEVFQTIAPTYLSTFIVANIILASKGIGKPAQFFLEFVCIVTPIILNLTITHHLVRDVVMALTGISLTVAFHQLKERVHVEPFVQVPHERPAYISNARATINIITTVCILAVDFQIFPRSLAKTETFGFGLMDTGVGLYVFGNGIVSSELNKNCQQRQKLQKDIISIIPLLVLGLARFITIRKIDYQVHTSEYGVHWNFFLTLAATKLFTSLIMKALRKPIYMKFIAIIILTFHQLILQLGLSNYVLRADVGRDNFITANREGLVSIPGYIALHFGSIYIGSLMRFEQPIKRGKDFLKKIGVLVVITLFLWKMIYVCDHLFGVSRRIANMGYVIWILSIGTTFTTLYMLMELFYHFVVFGQLDDDEEKDKDKKESYVPIIFRAINYNGLAFFLIANLLTGIVNLTFQTMLLDAAVSLLVLVVYMFILCSITYLLYAYDIKLKVW